MGVRIKSFLWLLEYYKFSSTLSMLIPIVVLFRNNALSASELLYDIFQFSKYLYNHE